MYIIAVFIFAADQSLKWLVRTHLTINQSVPLIPNVIGLLYFRNPGAAWSILPHGRWILTAVDLMVTIALIYNKQKYKPGKLASIGLALLLAGALGNCTDRVVFGTVTDYVQFLFVQFPIFNLADIAIDVGVILLLWNSFRSRQDRAS